MAKTPPLTRPQRFAVWGWLMTMVVTLGLMVVLGVRAILDPHPHHADAVIGILSGVAIVGGVVSSWLSLQS